jgi:cohesin loading factor subunit SCC2
VVAHCPLAANTSQDTGLGVRKRVIKLLKTIYLVKSEVDIRVDICTKLVSLMGDEDETVKVSV